MDHIYTGIIFGVILTLVLMYVLQNTFNTVDVSDEKATIIRMLVRQAARWSTAARQDENIVIAALHANYGAGYLWALKDIAKDDEIESVANIDILKFAGEITSTQDNVTKRMAKMCPEYAPDPSYLTRIGGEG